MLLPMPNQGDFTSAKSLLMGRSTQSVRGLLSPADRTNWYQFQLKRSSQLDVRLTGLRANISVALFDRSGQVIKQSPLRPNAKQPRRTPQQTITRTLEAGTYWVRLAASPGSRTTYRLRLAVAETPQRQRVLSGAASAAMPNASLSSEAIVLPADSAIEITPPQLGTAALTPVRFADETNPLIAPESGREFRSPSNLQPDTGLSLTAVQSPMLDPTVFLSRNQGLNTIRGNRVRITDSLLQAGSLQQSDPDQLVYTLTRLPQNALLELNGEPLSLGSRFTQQDVFSGSLAYRSTVPDSGLTELFRSSTSFNLYARGISDNSVLFVAEEYDPERDAIDVDLFLHDGSTVTQIADNVLTQPGNISGAGALIAVQGISGSTVLFSALNGETLETLYLYNGETLQILADNFVSAQGLSRGEKLVGSRAIWTDQQFRWLGNRPTPDDRIYATDLATGVTTRLAQESQFDQFVGFTQNGWVWTGTGGTDGGADREIFYYDDRTGQTQQLTQNSVNERDVRVSGSTIVWQTDQSSAILFYDGSSTRTIPTAAGDQNSIFAVSDTQIIYSSPTAIEYYAYEIATGRSTRLASSAAQFGSGLIAGSDIFWQETLPNGEVFFYSGRTQQSRPLTDQNTTNDRLLSVTDRGAFITSGDGENRQLYFFDSQTESLTQLTAPNSLNLRINDGSNLGLGGSSANPHLATWISRNPESFSLFNSSTLLHQLDSRSAVLLSSDASVTHIVGDQVAFQTTELRAGWQAGSPPIQEQVLYLYRASAANLPQSPVQDSFGFILSDGTGGAIEGSFTLQTA